MRPLVDSALFGLLARAYFSGVHKLLVFLALILTAAAAPMNPGKITITADTETLRVEFAAPGFARPGHALFLALDTTAEGGCAVVPYEHDWEGSTTFLPFRADRIFAVRIGGDGRPELWRREWAWLKWSARLAVADEFSVAVVEGKVTLTLKLAVLTRSIVATERAARPAELKAVVWAKHVWTRDGWGTLWPEPVTRAVEGGGDRALGGHWGISGRHVRETAPRERARIYQLLPRLFSNTNETRKANGTVAENGVGKFADISDVALRSLRDELGITHLWLTGVLAQASATDYSAIGKPADDPDLLKGLAGSPYAIKDYGDVCPDYAVEPAGRVGEFQVLLARVKAAGLRAVIDFVPNHVARSHQSAIATFGANDDPSRFFEPKNHFFWLQPDSPGGGAPLRLPTVEEGQYLSPTCRVLGAGDGLFEPEKRHARVTGNNAVTWSPSPHDWYETAKLNYGFDFTTGTRAYPNAARPDAPVPDTWVKMDAVLAHWQSLGVGGFRCDMAHMVPPEFWAWAIARARQRDATAYFFAEAYNNDPMKVEGGYALTAGFGNVMLELLNAGFDAVYDDPAYKALKRIFDGPGWANDLDAVLAAQGPFVFPNSLRYAENHDEVRLASRGNWGGHGAAVGRPVSAVLFGISRGPALLYSGQEVGEPAAGVEGFGGDDGRTSIFDYWAMPELAKWVNGHRYDGGRLSAEQKELRVFYGRLLKLCGEPAFRDGEFFPLNAANVSNGAFGRLDGENASGHWLYAFLRADARSGQRFLIVVNLHPVHAMKDVRILPGIAPLGSGTLTDRLSGLAARIEDGAVVIGEIPALTAAYLEVR